MPEKTDDLAAAAAKAGVGHLRRHLLLCVAGGECCSVEESLRVWDYAKKRLKELGLAGPQGVYRSRGAVACAFCTHGPIAVVYPEGTWYHSVQHPEPRAHHPGASHRRPAWLRISASRATHLSHSGRRGLSVRQTRQMRPRPTICTMLAMDRQSTGCVSPAPTPSTLRRWSGTPILGPLLRDRRVSVILGVVGSIQIVSAWVGISIVPCPMLHVVGYPCPGCGITRAVKLLAEGKFEQSLHLHVFAPWFLLAALLLLVNGLLPAKARRHLAAGMETLESRTGIVFLLLSLLVLYWVARMLYAPSVFRELMLFA